jgi:hypothetical protein
MAPCDKANVAMAKLQEMKSSKKGMDWPGNSTDLNLME